MAEFKLCTPCTAEQTNGTDDLEIVVNWIDAQAVISEPIGGWFRCDSCEQNDMEGYLWVA